MKSLLEDVGVIAGAAGGPRGPGCRIYPHGDLPALREAGERAPELPNTERPRIHEHCNRSETVGTIVADAIFAADREAARTAPRDGGFAVK